MIIWRPFVSWLFSFDSSLIISSLIIIWAKFPAWFPADKAETTNTPEAFSSFPNCSNASQLQMD